MPSTCALMLSLAAIVALAMASEPAAGKQLVSNPTLNCPPGANVPDQWSECVPDWEGARCSLQATPEGLQVQAPGRPFAVGSIQQTIAGVEGGKAYAVQASCELRGIEFPYQALTVRVEWLQGSQAVHPAGMLVRGPSVADHHATFSDVLIAPDNADGARITLQVRWPRGGAAVWHSVSVQPTQPPPSRKIKVGTVYLRPTDSTPAENLELWCGQIAAAGEMGLDIVCLGEAILMVGTGQSAVQIAEPIPGPATERLATEARKNRIWVVAGLMEIAGDCLYNTAVLLDREGQIAGKYRKVHLPREEWRKGVMPGHDYPVFHTELGTLAVQVCYDWFFPEVATIFAQQGAQIIFAPTWGTTFPDEDGRAQGETVFRVRARDNGVYMVPSVYDGSSMVIDPLGRILASNEGQTGVAWAEIDLNARECLEWVGYWRAIGPRDRMPTTYEGLTDTNVRPTY